MPSRTASSRRTERSARRQAGGRTGHRSTSPGAAGESCSNAATTGAASISRRCGGSALQRGLLGSTAKDLDAEDLVAHAAARRHQHVEDGHRVSGRGIGLDVVREAVERLGGEVGCPHRRRASERPSSSSSRRRSPPWMR